MWRHILLKSVKTIFLIFFILNNSEADRSEDKVTVGVVFDHNSEEIQNAFKYALLQHNQNSSKRLDVHAFVDVINTADVFKLSRLICYQFERGVYSMMGAVMPDSFDTLHSYTNTFQMPFVTPWFPEKVLPPSSGLVDHAVSMRPDYHRAVIDTIIHYGWRSIIYIYESQEGLLRLQQLFKSLYPGNETFIISHVKKVSNASEVVSYLRSMEKIDRWSNKYVVLDASTKLAKNVIISHVRDVQLGRRNYHYFLTGLVMDDKWDKDVLEFGTINVTGFRILDFSRRIVRDFMNSWKKEFKLDAISAKAVLMFDTVHVVLDALGRFQRKKPDAFRNAIRRAAALGNGTKMLDCNPEDGIVAPFEFGDKISRAVKKTDIVGLSGHIKFTESGHRHNFTLQVVELTQDGTMIKVATWSELKGYVPVVRKPRMPNMPGNYNRNKTYAVTTMLEYPYLMKEADETTGKTVYSGFCKDLADILADRMEITYEFQIVKDGKLGNGNPSIVSGYDGMVGEILRKEADMAIAPLPVTLEREKVVEFSKIFMSVDFNPTIKDVLPTIDALSFFNPLSKELWACLFLSIVVVAIILFAVSRFSPSEWRVVTTRDNDMSDNGEASRTQVTVINELSFGNSLWFSFGSFMQQKTDLSPKSLAGRIVCGSWWMFAIIMVSSYTANLTAHLTLERFTQVFENNNRHACRCTDHNLPSTYNRDLGAINLDAPYEEDVNTKPWINTIFQGDPHKQQKNNICNMLVSLSNNGLYDFAVAFPRGSTLREGVNLVLQAMKDDKSLQKLIRKWFNKSKCQIKNDALEPIELSLNQMSGVFYTLLGGLIFAIWVAFCEFCKYGKSEAARNNISLKDALKAKTSHSAKLDYKLPTPTNAGNDDNDRAEWNGTPYPGYYTSSHQEETELHGRFSHV